MKSVATDADEARFQHELRTRRESVPSAVTVLASQMQEQLGQLSEAITKLADAANAGSEVAERELVELASDAYEMLANARDALAHGEAKS